MAARWRSVRQTTVPYTNEMAAKMIICTAIWLFCVHLSPPVFGKLDGCSVRVRIESGWVCGARRPANNGLVYASFRGIPYAKQPLGQLRFQELQPVEPWSQDYDATSEGPVCPQRDLFYRKMMHAASMSEGCIHANVHVPMDALPAQRRPARLWGLRPPHSDGADDTPHPDNTTARPILVFIHGGGFSFGSADADVNGPENLVSRGVIVITFNYRVGPFGFLSLNSSSVPGNNGLRDMITFLQWVQRNAEAFGGDPNNVTLAGQSAGACAAHLLSLSTAAEGLFKRVILMSGVGIRTFFSTSPMFAQFVTNLFVTNLGINSTDADDIHRQLIKMPLDRIMKVSAHLQDMLGVLTFTPVVETPFPGVTTVLDNDPEVLISEGRGKHIPLIIGFTTAECESFRPRYEEIFSQIKSQPLMMVPPGLIYSSHNNKLMDVVRKIKEKYFYQDLDVDSFIKYTTDAFFIYPALKLAAIRGAQGGAVVYLYQFSYEFDYSVVKAALGLQYKGAAHIEDMTALFRFNSILGELGKHGSISYDTKDALMVDYMTSSVINFMKCSDPVCKDHDLPGWPPLNRKQVWYQNISSPVATHHTSLVDEQIEMSHFFEQLYNTGS